MTDRPGYSPDHIVRGLSLRRRIGYVVVGLGGSAAATLIGLLWATEPVPLPARTRLAFAGMIIVGVAWAGFAAWALARRPAFAVDRVVAASLALAFSTLTTVAAAVVALTRGSMPGLLGAGGLGLALTVASAVMLVRARAHRAGLLARRHALEQRAREAVTWAAGAGTAPTETEPV